MEEQRKIRKWIVMFAVFFLILIIGSEKKVCAEPVDTFSMNLTVTESYDRANQVLDYVNEERKRLGAQPLTLDADLQEAAMQRAAEQYVLYGHTRPDGSPSITVDATRKMVGENAQMGGQLLSAYEIYNSWKNSPGHYRAMVNPSVKTAGIGVCTQGGCGYAAILAFGYNQQINEEIKTGTCAKDRVISGLHVENCSFGGSSTVGGTYQFPYQTAVPLYLIYQGKTTGVRGNQLDAFLIRSLTSEIAEVADGMICAKASGKVVLQVCLKQEPSVAWPVSFSIQTKIPERQPESEQLSKAASDQVPAKTKKTVITHQKLPKIAITSLRSKKKGQLIIRWKKKQGIGGYEVQYGAQKTFKQAKTKKISGKGKTGITLKKLKRKRTYYVRIRSWKMVQGCCVYGAWSKACKIKVK